MCHGQALSMARASRVRDARTSPPSTAKNSAIHAEFKPTRSLRSSPIRRSVSTSRGLRLLDGAVTLAGPWSTHASVCLAFDMGIQPDRGTKLLFRSSVQRHENRVFTNHSSPCALLAISWMSIRRSRASRGAESRHHGGQRVRSFLPLPCCWRIHESRLWCQQ